MELLLGYIGIGLVAFSLLDWVAGRSWGGSTVPVRLVAIAIGVATWPVWVFLWLVLTALAWTTTRRG